MKSELIFENFEFHPVQYNDQPCLTLAEVASVLYGKGVPQNDAPFDSGVRQLNTLYRRHADEFTASMTALVKIQTAGGMQDVRVFSLRGAHLLGMLARTEAAKRFRRWALDVIEQSIAEQRGLVPQFHATLLEYTGKKAVASLCGKGLRQWRGEKPDLETRMHEIAQQIQPSLFLN